MSNRLRWKKHPKETGLASIGRDPAKRASSYTNGEDDFASVYSHEYGPFSTKKGWYWVAFNGVPYENTCNRSIATEAEAKAQAVAYVRKHLGAA